MKMIKSIIVVGSSGSGKTTLVNGLRGDKHKDLLVIPHRYITRPARRGDDLTENSYIDKETFQKRVKNGSMYPYWHRELDNGRIESYGFDAVAPDDTRLRVYSANNAFVRDKNESLDSILKNGLVVIVTADEETRTARLSDRSPDMHSDERNVRLKDTGKDLQGNGSNEVVIHTAGLNSKQGQAELQKIIREFYKEWGGEV